MPTASVTWVASNPVTVDWGDGSPAAPGPASGTATHVYTLSGPHAVTVTDSVSGLSVSSPINCAAPACVITACVDYTTGSTVLLSYDSTHPVTLAWGDGNTQPGAAGTVVNTVHDYGAASPVGQVVTITSTIEPACAVTLLVPAACNP